MSEDVLIACIAAAPGVIAAVTSWRGSRRTKELAVTTENVRATTERVRHQVENSHTTNLREEQDARHTEIVGAISRVEKDIGGLRADVRSLHTSDQQLDQRMQRVESTLLRL